MRIILPSESALPVPRRIDTVPALKAYIEKQTGIPGATQRLYTERDELDDDFALSALPVDVDIDLVIAAGLSCFICREGLRDRLDTISGEVFVTHASRLKSRDSDALEREPALSLAKVNPAPAPCEAECEPFFAAFAEKRDARLAQLKQTRAQLGEGPIVVSTFNWGYRDMVANWVDSCDRNGIDCRSFALFFPTDERAEAFAKGCGLRTYFDGESYGEQHIEGSKKFGDRAFRRMMFAKIAMTVDMLDVSDETIRQDVDVVWHCDPRPDLVRRAEQHGFDMLFMYDGPNPLHQPLHYNSGFVFIRANPFTRIAWNTILSNYGWVLVEGGEQRLINTVMNLLQPRGLSTARLPEDIYVNGHTMVHALSGEADMPGASAVVHASWTLNLEAKIERMRALELWYL